MHQTWTDEMLRDAIDMVGQAFTASHIAAHLSKTYGVPMTRNAVLGKLHRGGNSGGGGKRGGNHSTPEQIAAAREKARATMERKKKEAQALLPTEPEPLQIDGHPVRTMDLRDGMCRFPVGDASASMPYCGHETKAGSVYCPWHHKNAHQPQLPARAA